MICVISMNQTIQVTIGDASHSHCRIIDKMKIYEVKVINQAKVINQELKIDHHLFVYGIILCDV